MKTTIKNNRTVKSIDAFLPESSDMDILSIILGGDSDPTGPIIILPTPPKV